MATIRMVTEIKTLPMDEQERVVVPRNSTSGRTVSHYGKHVDVLTPSQVFTLIRQTAFGEAGDTPYSQYMVGDVYVRNITTMWNYTFQGVQLSAGLYPPYYRRVMVKKDGTFSIRDLRSKVVELQDMTEKERARRKTVEEQLKKEAEENTALLDSVAEGGGRFNRNPVPGLNVSVDNLQKKTVFIQLRGITVDEAKTLIDMYANKRLPNTFRNPCFGWSWEGLNESQDESEAN